MSGKSGCLRSAVGGCVGCAVVAVVLVVGLWMSRDAIRQTSWYKNLHGKVEAVQEEAKSLMDLRARLIAAYPADNVGVQVRMNSVNGVSTRTLQVEILNPTFPLPGDDAGKQVEAREIAAFVAREHPGISHYDQIRVSFARGGGAAGASYSSRTDFDFPVADLLPAGTAPSSGSTSPHP
jgi:hypothetical protein